MEPRFKLIASVPILITGSRIIFERFDFFPICYIEATVLRTSKYSIELQVSLYKSIYEAGNHLLWNIDLSEEYLKEEERKLTALNVPSIYPTTANLAPQSNDYYNLSFFGDY